MAYTTITYKNHSFEESPGLITWLQLYLLRFLSEQKESPQWTSDLAEAWELNAEIDIYKYFFSEELLDTADKEEWAIEFMNAAITKLNAMSLKEFGEYINEDIHPEVDYGRIKKILLNVSRMLKDKEPLYSGEN